jgi:hypothetical protein
MLEIKDLRRRTFTERPDVTNRCHFGYRGAERPNQRRKAHGSTKPKKNFATMK